MTERLAITEFRSVLDVTTNKSVVLSWADLTTKLAAFSDHVRKADVSGWSPAVFSPTCDCGDEKCTADRGHRITENAIKVYALVLDLDKRADKGPLEQPDADAALARLDELGLRRVVHTTHSHAPPTRVSLRVVVALSRAVPARDWDALWSAATAHIGIHVEPSCRNPDRFWYAPSHPPGAESWSKAFDGDALDVDALLARRDVKPPNVQTVSVREIVRPTSGAFSIDDFMSRQYPGAKEHSSRGKRCWDIECPWEGEHSSSSPRDTVVAFSENDGPSFSCLHDHCKELRHWREFRKFHQPDWVPFDERSAGSSTPPNVVQRPEYSAERVEAEVWRYGTPIDEWLGVAEPDDDDSGDWHVRGIIARDVASFIAGDPKVGKTMIMESLAIALAMGATEWCGFKIYDRRRVLVMPREDGPRTTAVRHWQLARGAGLAGPRELSEWLSIDPTSPLNLGNPDHIKRLRDACERFDVIMIDSFTTAHLGDENSSRDVAAALEPIRDLAVSTKTAIVLIHHYNGKGGADDKRGVKHRLRGSSAIAGYARHIVGVSHGPKRGQLEIASDGNLEYQVPPTLIELVNGKTDGGKSTLVYRLIGDAEEAALTSMRDDVIALVAAAEDGFSSANAIVKELGTSRKLALKAVKAELLVPVGRLERIGKRIYSRKVVPGTSENQTVPRTGSGSRPYRGEPRTGDEPTPEYWDR